MKISVLHSLFICNDKAILQIRFAQETIPSHLRRYSRLKKSGWVLIVQDLILVCGKPYSKAALGTPDSRQCCLSPLSEHCIYSLTQGRVQLNNNNKKTPNREAPEHLTPYKKPKKICNINNLQGQIYNFGNSLLFLLPLQSKQVQQSSKRLA